MCLAVRRVYAVRRIFGPKRDENRKCRKLHNEELHSLYRSPNIVRVIKYTRLRWADHAARMKEGRSAIKILTGKLTGKRPLRRLGVDGRIILGWNLKKWMSVRGIGLI